MVAICMAHVEVSVLREDNRFAVAVGTVGRRVDCLGDRVRDAGVEYEDLRISKVCRVKASGWSIESATGGEAGNRLSDSLLEGPHVAIHLILAVSHASEDIPDRPALGGGRVL